MASERVAVEWSARFRRDVTRLRGFADERPSGAHAAVLRGLEHLSEQRIGVAEHCFNTGTMLQADLKGVRRFKLGRGRLFYIASREKMMAVILHFGDTRRAGDPKRDAYADFRRLLRSTEFDRLFAKLDIEKPQL